MLALRLTRGARPAVQLRRLLVAVASAGTGFLLLCTLGHALSHPDDPAASLLRLAWCLTPLAATVYFAVAVARTDPGTRPRPGLAAIGLGPARLMAVSATTTALSCTLGSMLALLVFLHLRGDLTGLPFDGAAAHALAADSPLPLPATVTLLSLVPAIASVSAAMTLRPQGAKGMFGTRWRGSLRRPDARQAAGGAFGRPSAGIRATGAAPVPRKGGTTPAPVRAAHVPTATPATPQPDPDLTHTTAPPPTPDGLPWGITILAAGLATEAYAIQAGNPPGLTLPGGTATAPAVLIGWLLTALGLALAGPGLTHLCGHLLQSARPGPLRLLAGRILMAEATRIGRPLGVVCAVASAAYAVITLYDTADPSFGPLTLLGAALVSGCTVATLLTAALEAKQARADTTAALLRLGAPTAMLRSVAALRAGALLTVFVPLTLAVARLAALPLAR
ncbi:hypothetical protein F7R91_30545 [Streptomyces luteolifulvus]|uniref:Uncharacterized protein n=1 Tax=Streptomyces luteolifulvus TaxID=2615112 RepID=A0A6H9UTP2_9ACTN|nr:hypothetical protein [Streptomyces luteolifulvus]KAB1142025.1 hypothetical protein F7R91_30545 [Streptomyces luteolifulvus]